MTSDGPGQYTVIAHAHSHEIEIKRSRFLCELRRVTSEEEARDFVAEMRAAHRLARHHCSAFVLGPARSIQRSSDDGEPSGTAGRPMLDAITLRETAPGLTDLSDVVAVVIRWFGGVLLGAGGLVRAYSDAVSQTLDQSTFLTRTRMRILTLDSPHADAGRLEHDLRALGVTMLPTSYGAQATLRVAIEDTENALSALTEHVSTLTLGAGTLVPAGVEWVDAPFTFPTK